MRLQTAARTQGTCTNDFSFEVLQLLWGLLDHKIRNYEAHRRGCGWDGLVVRHTIQAAPLCMQLRFIEWCGQAPPRPDWEERNARCLCTSSPPCTLATVLKVQQVLQVHHVPEPLRTPFEGILYVSVYACILRRHHPMKLAPKIICSSWYEFVTACSACLGPALATSRLVRML